jgi:tetratricopeptide (TPR) repeat protein
MDTRWRLFMVLILGMGAAAWGQQAVVSSVTTRPAAAKSPGISRDKVRILLDKAREEGMKGNDDEQKKYLGQLSEIARQAWELQDAETCGAIFKQILSVKVDFLDALLGLAELYRRTNPIMAVDYYTKYMALNPNDPSAYYGRGSCYLSRNMYTLAIQDLKNLVVRLEPNHVGGLANLALAIRGQAAVKANDPELFREALEYMVRAVQAAAESKDPDIRRMIPELKYRLSQMSFDYNRILVQAKSAQASYDETISRAKDAIQTAVEISNANPEDRQAMNQILLALDILGEVYGAQIQENPKNPAPYLEMAKLINQKLMVQERDSQLLILSYIRKAVEADPKVPQNWFLLFQGYAQLGMSKQALSAIEKALALDPMNKQYRNVQAELMKRMRPIGVASQPGVVR